MNVIICDYALSPPIKMYLLRKKKRTGLWWALVLIKLVAGVTPSGHHHSYDVIISLGHIMQPESVRTLCMAPLSDFSGNSRSQHVTDHETHLVHLEGYMHLVWCI